VARTVAGSPHAASRMRNRQPWAARPTSPTTSAALIATTTSPAFTAARTVLIATTTSPAFTAARTVLIHDAYLARLGRRFQHRPSPHRCRHFCATAGSIPPASLAIKARKSEQYTLRTKC